jgi:hypothetical protein
MLSPMWLFAVPAAAGALLALAIFASALMPLLLAGAPTFFGDSWAILAAALLGISHLAGLLALGAQLYSVREGYRNPRPWMRRLADTVTLETMLMAGSVLFLAGVVTLSAVAYSWFGRDLMRGTTVVPAVIGTSLMTLGMQTVLGGFFLSILAGNEARFLRSAANRGAPPAAWLEAAVTHIESAADCHARLVPEEVQIDSPRRSASAMPAAKS